MHDELGDHGVVIRADAVAFAYTAVPAHIAGCEAMRQGYSHDLQATGCGQKIVVRGFGANAGFDGMALHLHLCLRQGQCFTCCDAQLPLHQIQTRHRFGHRVFHLQAGVHFHEEEVHAAIGLLDDELHRARTHIVHRFGRRHRSRAHALAHLLGQSRRRGLFQHLLMAPLHRAITFV